MTFEWYPTELDALNAERRAIHVEHPEYNKQHRHVRTIRKPAPRGKPKAKQSAAREPTPQRTWPEIEAAALTLRAAEPGISGSELGRRLGVSDARGRQIARKLAKTAPQEAAADGPQ